MGKFQELGLVFLDIKIYWRLEWDLVRRLNEFYEGIQGSCQIRGI